MYSISTIKAMNKKTAIQAKDKKPYLAKKDKDSGVFECPNFGDYKPKGYKIIDTIFVDNSGFGLSTEPAFTAEQFQNTVKKGYGYAIVEEGQFQVVIGVFKKV